jgi:hypothetical protein
MLFRPYHTHDPVNPKPCPCPVAKQASSAARVTFSLAGIHTTVGWSPDISRRYCTCDYERSALASDRPYIQGSIAFGSHDIGLIPLQVTLTDGFRCFHFYFSCPRPTNLVMVSSPVRPDHRDCLIIFDTFVRRAAMRRVVTFGILDDPSIADLFVDGDPQKSRLRPARRALIQTDTRTYDAPLINRDPRYENPAM